MIEAMLFITEESLLTVMDAIDIYEGSVPPAATFQVIDVDDNATITQMEDNNNVD